MSDGPVAGGAAPAVALWEFGSIVDGIHAADAIAKASPVRRLLSGTTQPGKYIVLVAGDTASVDVARDTVDELGVAVQDTRFLPDVAPSVVAAFDPDRPGLGTGDAIGVVETTGVASCVDAADAAVKAAAVALPGLHLADELGGKAYLVVEGGVGDVEAAVEAATERAGPALVNAVVIPQLTQDLRDDLRASDRFLGRLGQPGGGSA